MKMILSGKVAVLLYGYVLWPDTRSRDSKLLWSHEEVYHQTVPAPVDKSFGDDLSDLDSSFNNVQGR